MITFQKFAFRIKTGRATKVIKPCLKIRNVTDNVKADNHNFRTNVTTNEKHILRKIGLKFRKIAL